jgi:hypothetical protein
MKLEKLEPKKFGQMWYLQNHLLNFTACFDWNTCVGYKALCEVLMMEFKTMFMSSGWQSRENMDHFIGEKLFMFCFFCPL